MRSSTLIDPESLQRPISRHRDSLGTALPLGRRNSTNAQPLLNFNDDELGNRASLTPNSRIQKSRSVFGTDTLWQSEMAKVKVIEAQEQLEKEEREKREAEDAARIERKKRKGKKGKAKAKILADGGEDDSKELEDPAPISAEVPMLPALQKASVRKPLPPPVNDDDTESESDDSEYPAPARRKAGRGNAETAADRWVAGSSDEDEGGPRRTTGVGPRYRNRDHSKSLPADDDSEEDIPLAATVGRALQRAVTYAEDDSDEDIPLSTMLDKAKLNVPPINFDNLSASKPRDDDDDDDDQPLGLRASMIPPLSHSYAGEDDDDKPLAFHPDQQRRKQYHAMAQQQQMMMQAQMQQSMFFGAPSIMPSGFFGPPMAPMPTPMMMGLQPMPSPLAAPDAGKFGLVDKWRRDVAVEGQP
jgi:hypothetical protein